MWPTSKWWTKLTCALRHHPQTHLWTPFGPCKLANKCCPCGKRIGEPLKWSWNVNAYVPDVSVGH